MPEYGILWRCQREACGKWQTRVNRVPNEIELNDKIIVQKARKIYLKCIYCQFRIKWSMLRSSEKKFVSTSEGKGAGTMNRYELR